MAQLKSTEPGNRISDYVEAASLRKLNSPFLKALAPEAQAHIVELSKKVAATLQTWAADYPMVRQVRILPLSLSIAASAPFAGVSTLISTAKVSLWIFALDDMFDEGNVPESDLLRQAELFRRVIHGEFSGIDFDDMVVALREIRDDLASYRLFAPLKEEWTKAMQGTLDEMIREYRWSQAYRQHGAAMLPTYDDYAACGRYSIGGPPHIWSAVITIDDPSTPQNLALLRQMEEISSVCIRLANDLQSNEKEAIEGKVNSLTILSNSFWQRGSSAVEAARLAQKQVRTDIRKGLEQLSRLQAHAGTETRQPEAAITDIARFVCEFYSNHDFHTFGD